MSMATVVNQAIQIAKKNLGDLVVAGTLKQNITNVYDPDTGGYVKTADETPIEMTVDKFNYMEMQAADFSQSDLKVIVFNTIGIDLNISTADYITFNEIEYAVRSVNPVYVGNIVSVYEVALRK